MSVALPSSVPLFPPLIVNKARGNDASRGQMDGDVDARHPDAAGMYRWPSHLSSCGVRGRRRDPLRACVRLARARRTIWFPNRPLLRDEGPRPGPCYAVLEGGEIGHLNREKMFSAGTRWRVRRILWS
jgi:hypothetical protein